MVLRAFAVNVGLLCGTVLLFFGGIESVLRLTGLVIMQDYTPPIYERSDNPDISYRLKPNIRERAFRNTIATNGLGFRSPEIDTTKPLLVVLGDSIAFGYGVANNETLSANLQTLLPSYDIQNAGVPGYNIRQEAALYKESIAPLDPKALILLLYWNDFDRSLSWLDEKNVLRPKGWVPQEKQCDPIKRGLLGRIPGRCFLDLHSALYRIVKGFVNTRSATQEREAKRREEVATNNSEETNMFVQDLAAYEHELSLLSSRAPQERLFVMWPDATYLHSDERKELARIAKKNGFAVLDLYDHFGNTMETLDWDYIHPSPAALVQAATIIHDALGL